MTSDKSLIKRRFEAQLSRYDRLALVQQQICEQLSEYLSRIVIGQPGRAMEVGIGTGFLTRRLAKQYAGTQWFLNDITQETRNYADKYVDPDNSQYVWGDAESIEFPTELQLITSASTIQWFDDLPGFVDKCARATTPGGYLAITTFGKQNFAQIKQLTDEGLEYYTLEELGGILENRGYSIIESCEYTKDMHFDTPTEVLKHIKATGVNGLKHTTWTKRSLQQFENDYRSLCPERIALTYHPIIIVAKLG